MRTCRALTQPMIERVERVANAAPSTPNFGIKNTFKAKFIEKAIAVFIKTILGNQPFLALVMQLQILPE